MNQNENNPNSCGFGGGWVKDSYWHKYFGLAIKNRRKALKISAKDLAMLADIPHRQTLEKIEQGIQKVTMPEGFRLANALAMNWFELINSEVSKARVAKEIGMSLCDFRLQVRSE